MNFFIILVARMLHPTDVPGVTVATATPYLLRTHGSPSQVAADLLRSPGRGPQEADALFDYMVKEEHVWRT